MDTLINPSQWHFSHNQTPNPSTPQNKETHFESFQNPFLVALTNIPNSSTKKQTKNLHKLQYIFSGSHKHPKLMLTHIILTLPPPKCKYYAVLTQIHKIQEKKYILKLGFPFRLIYWFDPLILTKCQILIHRRISFSSDRLENTDILPNTNLLETIDFLQFNFDASLNIDKKPSTNLSFIRLN